MMNSIALLIYLAASQHGIDPHLAISVALRESRLDPSAVGKADDIGLFQVREVYSKYTKEELFDPDINIQEGIRKLAEAKRGCEHEQWLVCFNRGVTGGSRLRYPEKDKYYRKVMHTYSCVKRFRPADFSKIDLVKECLK